MKTAMQELLDWVQEFEDKPVKPTLTNVKEKIWQLLPKEYDSVLSAYDKGIKAEHLFETLDASEYFKQTYKNETAT